MLRPPDSTRRRSAAVGGETVAARGAGHVVGVADDHGGDDGPDAEDVGH